MSDISKDLQDQPKFKDEIGSKDQDHHTFELEKPNTLKKIQNFLHGNPTMVPVIILFVSVAAFGLIAGGKFFSAFNLSLIIQQVTIVGILAAAQTSKIVNIKKGQFMNPTSMKFAVDKAKDSGNDKVIITERGSMFGYQDLIVDFRGIPKMKELAPVILDVTHSLQQPNQPSGVTGGNPELIETIAKAGIASGVDGLFIETHPSPENAKSDGKNMLPLEKLENLLVKLLKIKSAI